MEWLAILAAGVIGSIFFSGEKKSRTEGDSTANGKIKPVDSKPKKTECAYAQEVSGSILPTISSDYTSHFTAPEPAKRETVDSGIIPQHTFAEDWLSQFLENTGEVQNQYSIDVTHATQQNRWVLEFQKYGIHSLWHMTHRDNVESILRSGILSHSKAHRYLNPNDISNHGVQVWRERLDPIHNRRIHDYAPLYIDIRNPMLYVRKEMRDQLCLIEIALSVLDGEDFIFTDGNAASRDTSFYNSQKDLNKMPWDVLSSRYWTDFSDGKRKKCAEVLIPEKISPEHISAVHCYSPVTQRRVMNAGHNAIVSSHLFF